MQDMTSTPLSDDLLERLTHRGQLKTYSKNEILVVEGEQSDSLFILVKGQLKVFTRDSKGREVVYNILQAGEVFGEMFLDGGNRSASVKATGPAQCVVIHQSEIRELIAAYPEFALSLIQSLIARLRNATRMIKSLVLNDVYERTATLLNQVALTEGELRIVPPNLTQQEIADRVGATREMVNHVIAELLRGNFLSRDENRRLVFSKSLPAHW